jgi:hypothetical protein
MYTQLMGRLKGMLRIGGMVTFIIGGFCLPWPRGDNPKLDLSVFYPLRSMHAFVKMGMILMAIGSVAFIMALLLPDQSDSDR